MNRRRRPPVAEEGNGDVGGDAGLPEGRGSMGKKEGVEAEPLSASARLGVAGGHGYGDDDGELRSVVCARGKQRREWGPGGERGGAGGEGGSVASRGSRGGCHGEAGGGGLRVRACVRCPSSWQRRKRTRRRRRWAGPARWGSWAGWWAARVRPGRLYSFYFFLSVLF